MYISDSEARCVTPARTTPSTSHVTVSNDGRQYSGWPLVYTKGSGTFLKFIFDNSEPGCLDCVNSVYGNGLNPTFVTEKWHLDNATGPYIGGTLVTITAKGLNWPDGVAPTISSCPAPASDTTVPWAVPAPLTRTTSTR